MEQAGKSTHLLIRAARGEVVERSPVWAMRQAGRWDPEFNRIRAGTPFFEFSEDVDRAAEATLAPRRFGVDGIILFYDITTLPFAMGQPFTLQPHRGPVPEFEIRSRADLDRLDAVPDPSRYAHIIELIRKVKRQLNGELPVLVFAGAPFTVATYCIGTGKNIDQTVRFAREQPELWTGLLKKLSHATVAFLNTLIDEGAELYQLFDSWAGELSPEQYAEWAQPYHREIFAGANRIPRVLFVKEGPDLDAMARTGADVISLGVSHDLAAARAKYPDLAFQGNVDEELLQKGTREQVIEATKACLRAGGGFRHIVNLSHGVDRSTPVENFKAYIDTARGFASD
jgi:uroporphyrinogen decarboxylase